MVVLDWNERFGTITSELMPRNSCRVPRKFEYGVCAVDGPKIFETCLPFWKICVLSSDDVGDISDADAVYFKISANCRGKLSKEKEQLKLSSIKFGVA